MTGRPLADDVEAIRSPFAANMLESLPASKPRWPRAAAGACGMRADAREQQ